MHNMIMEDECEDVAATLEFENMSDPIKLPYQNLATFDEFIQMTKTFGIEQLKKDLIEHLWVIKGDN